MTERYTPDAIRGQIKQDVERLFRSYAINRPENWSVDQRTRDIVCISVWMREELMRLELDEVGRKVQEGEFNRKGRSYDDLFALASDIMNDALDDNINRNRRIHRRWG